MAGDGDDFETSLPEISPEAMARAEAALAGLTQRYITWAEADLARLRAALDDLRAGAPQAAGTLFTVSHDMKGQAATFGYPLVTELGNRLCRQIEAGPAPDGPALDRIVRLVDAIGQVIAARLDGDGGPLGQALLDGTRS